MDEFWNNIINHPNFGRAIASSPRFRSVFMQLAGDTTVSRLLSRFQFGSGPSPTLIDAAGATFSLGVDESGRTIPGETFTQLLARASMSHRMGITQRRAYGGGIMGGQYFSGGQTNITLAALARERGWTPEVYSFHFGGRDTAVEELRQLVGRDSRGNLLGLVRSDPDVTTVLKIRDQRGNYLTMGQISHALGFQMRGHPNVMKRINMFLTDRQVGRLSDPGDPMKVFLFDPAKVFGSNPELKKLVKQMMDSAPGMTEEEIYKRMSDGMTWMTRAELRRTRDFMAGQLRHYKDELRTAVSGGLSKNSSQYIQSMETIRALQRELDKIEEAVMNGVMPGGANIRTFGAVDFLNKGRRVAATKGDVVLASDELGMSILRHSGIQGTDDELRAMLQDIGMFISKHDVKDEIIPRAADPRSWRSTMNMFFQPKAEVGKAFSNSLTLAQFGDFINPSMGNGANYLLQSLGAELDEHIADIKSGRMKPGLLKIIDDLADKPIPLDISQAELQERLRSQQFARRLREFIRSGGDISRDPFWANQMVDMLRQEYIHIIREPDGSGLPRMMRFAGQDQQMLRLRFPMKMAVRSHFIPEVPDINGTTSILPGTARYNEEFGRYEFNAIDRVASHMAEGGSDLDDALVLQVKYDPQTRRALYHSMRDPTAMGEYQFFDIDMSADPNVDIKIRELAGKRKRLIQEIRDGHNKAGLQAKADEIYRINDILDRYMRGEAIYENGVKIIESNRHIATIDLARTYARDEASRVFPMLGFQVDQESIDLYSRPDVLRGFVKRGDLASGVFSNNPNQLRQLQNQALIDAIQNADPNVSTSLFRFMGDKYNPYIESGFFQAPTGSLKEKLEAQAKAASFLTEDQIWKRAELDAKNQALLGRVSNQKTIRDWFFRTYMNTDSYGDIDPAAAREFQRRMVKEWKSFTWTWFNNEAIIDAAVKTGDFTTVEAIESVLSQQAQQIGQLIRRAQEFAPEGMSIGLDPFLMAERGGASLSDLLKGYGTDDARAIILDDMDPKSDVARIYQQMMEVQEDLVVRQAQEVRRAAAQNVLNDLADFAPTAEETARAQDLFAYYHQNLEELKAARSNIDLMSSQIFDSLEANDIEALMDSIDNDAAQARVIMRMNEMGLLDDIEALNRQMLALNRLAAEYSLADPEFRGTGFDMIRRGPANPAIPSLSEMSARAFAARHEEDLINQIRQASIHSSADEFESLMRRFFRWDKKRNRYNIRRGVLDPLGNPYINERRIFEELAQGLGIVHRSVLDDTASAYLSPDELRNLQRQARRLDQARRFSLNQTQEIFGPGTWERSSVPLPPGMNRFLAREVSDQAAQTQTAGPIVSDMWSAMKRFDRQAVADLMQIRGVREAGIGLGIFAGIGLLYGVKQNRGERTPEEMAGPPLLPGGSAYEEFDQVPLDLASIYSSVNHERFNSGSLYRVNVRGSGANAMATRDQMQKLTGSPVDMRIFETRQTMPQNRTSQQMLADRI